MLEEYSERSSGVDGSTDKDTDEQGGVNLLGYKSQGDGDNRWKNRDKAKVHSFHKYSLLLGLYHRTKKMK